MKLDLSSKSELDWLAHLLADVESAVPGLNPLLVGAQARDLLLHRMDVIAIGTVTANPGRRLFTWSQAQGCPKCGAGVTRGGPVIGWD